MNDAYLAHYGILGMKWGVRRASGAATAGKAKKRASKTGDDAHDDYKKAHGAKSSKTMSDKELRDRINRLQMEKQYSQLSGSTVNRGRAYAQKLFKAGTTVAAVSTTALTLYNNAEKIKNILQKAGGK